MSIFSLFAKPKPLPAKRAAARVVVAKEAVQTAQLARDASWTRRPERPAEQALSPEAMAWLDTLPDAVKPVQLTLRYPRILNRLSLLAGEPQLLLSYLKSLMIDDRGGRQGFPGRIPFELQDVYDHIEASSSLRPKDPWAVRQR